MFKAFLRTDGTVTVNGGDIAWSYQRKAFQKLCTKLFATKFATLPEKVLISDYSPKERTILCEESHFVGTPIGNVSDQEYQESRSILLSIMKRENSDSNRVAG